MSLRRALMLAVLAAVIALPGSAYATFQYPEAPVVTVRPPAPPTAKQLVEQQAQQAQQNQARANQFGLVSPTYVPAGVNAAGVYTTPVTPGSKTATATYKLDWTIGAVGKSGCLVCHGDRNLRRVEGGRSVSLYVDTVVLEGSSHAKLLCTDCHVDFAYKTPHPSTRVGDNWRTVAKSSCGQTACHPQEFLDWAKSAHSTAGSVSATSTVGRPDSSAPGKQKPLCGDCHSGHAVPAKSDVAGNATLRASAMTRCGDCHTKSSQTYDDYYHGAAYRRGAPDAPACWQCHGTHLILPSINRQSATNPDNLLATCSQCHKAAGESYVQQYSGFVHTKAAVLQKNPIVSAVDTATAVIEKMFHSVLSAFGKTG